MPAVSCAERRHLLRLDQVGLRQFQIGERVLRRLARGEDALLRLLALGDVGIDEDEAGAAGDRDCAAPPAPARRAACARSGSGGPRPSSGRAEVGRRRVAEFAALGQIGGEIAVGARHWPAIPPVCPACAGNCWFHATSRCSPSNMMTASPILSKVTRNSAWRMADLVQEPRIVDRDHRLSRRRL